MRCVKPRNIQQEKGLYQGGLILLLTVFMLAAAYHWAGIRVWIPPCVIHRWTGYYCPGCGGTRAFQELWKGHLASSLCYHPVVLYGAVLYSWFMISHTLEYLSKGKLRMGMRYSDNYLYGAAGIILVQWVLKNLIKFVWEVGI